MTHRTIINAIVAVSLYSVSIGFTACSTKPAEQHTAEQHGTEQPSPNPAQAQAPNQNTASPQGTNQPPAAPANNQVLSQPTPDNADNQKLPPGVIDMNTPEAREWTRRSGDYYGQAFDLVKQGKNREAAEILYTGARMLLDNKRTILAEAMCDKGFDFAFKTKDSAFINRFPALRREINYLPKR